MTKTAPTSKIQYITEPYAAKPASEQKSKSQGISDSYAEAGSNAYKGLVAGNKAKAEPIAEGVIGEMMDAAENKPIRKLTYYDKIQNILSAYASIGDTKENVGRDINGDIPVIPDLRKDILDGHNMLNVPMRPVVQRYSALEKVLIKMLTTAKRSLKSDRVCNMTATEIRSMQSYEKKLNEALANCRQQLGDAINCRNQQIKEDEFAWLNKEQSDA
ncbi:MAG: hypothetical protein WC956_04160 [bacterium]